jgi:hypothetical protein
MIHTIIEDPGMFGRAIENEISRLMHYADRGIFEPEECGMRQPATWGSPWNSRLRMAQLEVELYRNKENLGQGIL